MFFIGTVSALGVGTSQIPRQSASSTEDWGKGWLATLVHVCLGAFVVFGALYMDITNHLRCGRPSLTLRLLITLPIHFTLLLDLHHHHYQMDKHHPLQFKSFNAYWAAAGIPDDTCLANIRASVLPHRCRCADYDTFTSMMQMSSSVVSSIVRSVTNYGLGTLIG